jgi:hypothetical protein
MLITFRHFAGPVILMVSLLLPYGAGPQQSKDGTIEGHVLACNDGVIPGASVMLTGPAINKSLKSVTDKTGGFRMAGLRPGVYSLEILVHGFRPLKRTGIELAGGGKLVFDVTLQLEEARGEAIATQDLPTLWRSVDAVVYLRIQESLGTRPLRTEGQCVIPATEHKASILEVFRRYRGEPRNATVNFLQRSAGMWHSDQETITGRETPCKPGEELVAFLSRNENVRAFQGEIIVPVRDGQVRSPHIEELLKGMKLEVFLEKLRAMME